MSITKDTLIKGTADRAKAVFAAKDTSGKTGITGEKFVLPGEELAIITEMLNLDNPLAAYAGVTVTGQGAGSIEVKYDIYNDNWATKAEKGSSLNGGDNIIISDEVFKWNASNKKEESMSAYDIKRGAPDTLASRMSSSSIKFLQQSIKSGFKALVHETAGIEYTLVGATNPIVPGHTKGTVKTIEKLDITSRDLISKFKIQLIQTITKFAIDNEIDPGDLIVTLEPTTFDALAENGMIGDRATQTFAGGQYSVGTLAGYRVQAGGMYIPSSITGTFPTAAGVAGTGSKAHPVYAFVGTSQVALHAVDFVAANAGKLGLSNDQGTYLEMGDIFGALDYQGKFKKSQGLVILDEAK